MTLVQRESEMPGLVPDLALSGFGWQPNMTPLQFRNSAPNGICVGLAQLFNALHRFVEEH